MKNTILSFFAAASALAFQSCSYREYAPADYPAPVIYLAATTVSEEGIITLDSSSDVYFLNEAKTEFGVHMAVMQSGVRLGSYRVELNYANSKVNMLIDDGTFAVGTLPLPRAAASFPEYVDLTPSDDTGAFDLKFNTSYLKDPEFLGKKFAMALTISCEDGTVNPDLDSIIFLIDPSLIY